jgi:FlgN protein
MSLSEISNILWRERRLLELLVFKLEEECFVLASGRTRWLSHAAGEVETILEEIKRVELERAIAVAASTGALGMSDAPSLREIAAVAAAPWDGIFAEHRHALVLLAHEIDAVTTSNREMLQRGLLAASEVLGAPARPRRASGRLDHVGQRSVQCLDTARISQAGVIPDEEMTRLDLQAKETTYRAALAAAAKALRPSLAAFLQ